MRRGIAVQRSLQGETHIRANLLQMLVLGLRAEKKLARETGLEPATSGVTGRRSNQLSYSPANGKENPRWVPSNRRTVG